MFPLFDKEAMERQIAEAQAARKEAEARYAAEALKPEDIGVRAGFVHAASILAWVRLAEIAGVPHIPAETVASIPMDAVWKALDSLETTPEEREALDLATAYCDGGGFWRSELCAGHDVKYAMAQGEPMPDHLPLFLDDPRLIDMHHNMPDLKVISRPRMTPATHAGFPVEFRTFFGGAATDGAVSWYYPQAGRFDVPAELEAAMDEAVELGRRLHETRAHLGIIPALPDRGLLGAEIGSTIDFMLTRDRGLVLVDAGPGFGYGAHPCCFIDRDVEGRRWHLDEGVELR